MESQENNYSGYVTYSRPQNWTSAVGTSVTLVSGGGSTSNATTNGGIFVSRSATRSQSQTSSNSAGSTTINISGSTTSVASTYGTKYGSTSSRGDTTLTGNTSTTTTVSNSGETLNTSNLPVTGTSDVNSTFRYMDTSASLSVDQSAYTTTLDERNFVATMPTIINGQTTYQFVTSTNQSIGIQSLLPYTFIATITATNQSGSTYEKTIASLAFSNQSVTIPGVTPNAASGTIAKFTTQTNSQTITFTDYEYYKETLFLLAAIENQPEVLWWPQNVGAGTAYGQLTHIYSSYTQSYQTRSPQTSVEQFSRAATIVTIDVDSNGNSSLNGSPYNPADTSNYETYTTSFNPGIPLSNTDDAYTFSDTTTGLDSNGNFESGTIEGFWNGFVTYSQEYTVWHGSYTQSGSHEVLSSKSTTILRPDSTFLSYTTTTQPFINLPTYTDTTTIYLRAGLISTVVGTTYSYTQSHVISVWDENLSPQITNRTGATSTQQQSLSETHYTEQTYGPIVERIPNIFAMHSLRRIWPQGFAGWASKMDLSDATVMGVTWALESEQGAGFSGLSLESSDLESVGLASPAFTDEQAWTDYHGNKDLLLKYFTYETNPKFQYFNVSKASGTATNYYAAQYVGTGDSPQSTINIRVIWTSTTLSDGRTSTISKTQQYVGSLVGSINTAQKYYAQSSYDPATPSFTDDALNFGGFGTQVVGGQILGRDYFTDSVSLSFSLGYLSVTSRLADTSNIYATSTSTYSNSDGLITLEVPADRYIVFQGEPVYRAYITSSGVDYGEQIKRIHPNPGVAGEYDNQ